VEVLALASADLHIQTLTASSGSGELGVSVTIENLGAVGGSAFWLDVFVDSTNTLGPGDVGDDLERISWLGPGEVSMVQFSIAAADVDPDLAAVVDIEDEVDESNEGNNQAIGFIAAGGSGGTPWAGSTGSTWSSTWGSDLHIERVDWLSDGTSVYCEVEIANDGSTGAGPFWLDVYADQTVAPVLYEDGDAYTEVGWIGPWDTVVVDFWVEESCTWCWSWVQVDGHDTVVKWTESDNVFGPVDVYLAGSLCYFRHRSGSNSTNTVMNSSRPNSMATLKISWAVGEKPAKLSAGP
jgi:hypothetical protein